MHFLFSFCSLLVLTSCTSTIEEPIVPDPSSFTSPSSLHVSPTSPQQPVVLQPVPLPTLARQLSGQDNLSEYQHLPRPLVKKFHRKTKKGWEHITRVVLTPLREWQPTLTTDTSRIRRIFYAFGGPDATHVTQLFPDADEYILIGQETPGSQQSALRLLESVPNMYLLIDCMRSFFKRGYFITHDMAQQLSTKKAIGVAPLILAQLSRLGFKIIALQNFSETDTDAPWKQGLRGFRLTFSTPEGKTKQLIYIKCSLDNCNEETLQHLYSYVSEVPFVTFIKSASYTLHDSKSFSQIRNFILRSSYGILQDDSGIPYKYFKNNFDVRLFGVYEKPTLPVFDAFLQEDLKAAYGRSTPSPLPFRLGYGCWLFPSNLLWAKRHVDAEVATSVQKPAPAPSGLDNP